MIFFKKLFKKITECHNCGASININDNYCSKCGKLTKKSLYCKNCENLNWEDSNYCEYCGTNLKIIKETTIDENRPKNDVYYELAQNINTIEEKKFFDREQIIKETAFLYEKENCIEKEVGTVEIVYPQNVTLADKVISDITDQDEYIFDDITQENKEIIFKEEIFESTNAENEVNTIKSNELNIENDITKNMLYESLVEESESEEEQIKWNKFEIQTEERTKGKLTIKKIIEASLEETKINCITLKKILGRIYTIDETLIDLFNLNIENLPTFIRINYSEYKIKGNFVCKGNIMSIHEMIVEYFKDYTKVEHNDVLKFFNTIGYENHKSYSIYFDDLISNGFVYIDKEVVIKKESFEIDDNKIEQIRKTIDFFIDNGNGVNISKNKRIYMLMPILEYKWNELLLKTIIDKYLCDIYQIKEIEQNYEIRRSS